MARGHGPARISTSGMPPPGLPAGFRRLGMSPLSPPVPGSLAQRLKGADAGFWPGSDRWSPDARVFLTHLRRAVSRARWRPAARLCGRTTHPKPDRSMRRSGAHAHGPRSGAAERGHRSRPRSTPPPAEAQALLRLYWFHPRVRSGRGAGRTPPYKRRDCFSSFGELPHAFGCTRPAVDLEAIIAQDYAHDRMQASPRRAEP